ncbi:MAG: hypothetical protein R2813_11115 [Flavobacteriales bacterium]
MKTFATIVAASTFFISLGTSTRTEQPRLESDLIQLKVVLSYQGSEVSPAIYEMHGLNVHKITDLEMMDKSNPLAGHSANFQILSNVLIDHLDCYNIASVESFERGDCGRDVLYTLSRQM